MLKKFYIRTGFPKHPIILIFNSLKQNNKQKGKNMKKNEIAEYKNNMIADCIYKFSFKFGDKNSMKEVKDFLKMLNGERK